MPRILKRYWLKDNKSRDIKDIYCFDINLDLRSGVLNQVTIGTHKNTLDKFAIKIISKIEDPN